MSQVVARLKADPKLQVRISGGSSAAEDRRAREQALARALAVQRYLVRQGVLSDAIKVDPVTDADKRDAVALRLVAAAA